MFVFSPEKLHDQRVGKGWSFERLAAESDLSYQTVFGYEHGYRTPTRASLLRLAAALDVHPSGLVEIDPAFQAVAQ